MGKKLVIPGADFSTNGIAIPMVIKIAAGQSVVIGGNTYSGGTNGEAYELDTIPSTLHENSAVTYLELVTVNTPEFILKDGYFQYQQGLKKLSILQPVQVTNDLKTAFAYCRTLAEFNGINNIETAGVTNFSQMFRSCEQLVNLSLTHFDTSSATTLSNMFAGCANLKTLDLSSFVTTSVTDMSRVFSGCSHLETLILGTGWTMIGKTVTDLFYLNVNLTSIVAPKCLSTEYGTSGTELMALINAIQGSGYNVNRNSRPLVITCGDNKTVTGTYVHGTGWSWVVES